MDCSYIHQELFEGRRDPTYINIRSVVGDYLHTHNQLGLNQDLGWVVRSAEWTEYNVPPWAKLQGRISALAIGSAMTDAHTNGWLGVIADFRWSSKTWEIQYT
jgi:hypothetical protein